ncbi:aminotransferase class I/II-fold pyridoxal phosphate-dependent enzyme [Psychromarinibacter sp. C21-152]|uniref:Aminotransferase class I/II-fold pyridoxal phosphate-dependent enzyme n=1 Tax=Psychromarinibacter sediminicola TaxID=3033385 RepID=A0AAE3NTP9_9RHOB|nr:aminotransferase class I/II-fold pyridoxal phosphate-dependent enzyme [Psychromarinibacter sediminicola]MDF0601469.1 aminotransferase class I/II-fold pyridoxal phosphate-dependent enzyme [Psychromarinibacter sediminicola]
MNHDDLRDWSKRAADWAHDYHMTLRDRPVRAQVSPGETAAKLPASPPEAPESPEAIFADFERIVPDAMTHWQHPRFFAYFPANAAPASMWAEQLANAMASNCLIWQASPAATEIEQVTTDWLRQALGLPEGFTGTIHDSASTCTLSAVITMRDRATGWDSVQDGLTGQALRVYASAQTHSSVDKAVRLAGIGQRNLVKIDTDAAYRMDPAALERAIEEDRAAGRIPAGLVICTGGTGIGALDPAAECIAVAKKHDLYVHVDAAWAGSAMICPEFRALWAGVEGADSIVFNPHKWLGVQFDCSVQFLADPAPQIRSLGLRPDYLQTQGRDEIVNFNEWTVALGRRFRALKLWFVLRAYGLEDLRTRIRNHVAWTEELAEAFRATPGFEIVTEPRLALFSFRYAPEGGDANAATEALLARINDDGRVYLTQTVHEGKFVIRVTAGTFDCTRDDVMAVHEVVTELARA